MSLISTWSKTAGNNNLTPPYGWPEGQAPSTVNNCAREMMATIRIQMQDAQWFNWGFVSTRISGVKFSMLLSTASATVSAVAAFTANRRIKLYDTSTMYGTISEASLSATTINITYTPDSGSLTNSFSSVALSILSTTNSALPAGQTIYQDGSQIYAADAGANDTYVIALAPAITAYTTGMVINFKANTANTGAATLNVNGVGAVTIKKQHDLDLATGDIESGQIVTVVYDGTNFQMQSQVAITPITQTGTEIYGVDAGASDTYAITLTPAPAAYATGMIVNFKANTANTGAATLNVNGLGAKTILKTNDTALDDNDIEAGQIVTVVYDGTNFQMQSQTANSASGGGSAASQAQMEAASATTVYSSPGRQQYHPGHPKAWVCWAWSAGVPTIGTSYNVASLDDVGTGDVRINFTTAFSTANYGASLAPGDDTNVVLCQLVVAATASAYRILMTRFSTDNAYDSNQNNGAAFFGDQA